MGRLRTAPSRLTSTPPPSRFGAGAPVGEVARLAERNRIRPNWQKTARWQRLVKKIRLRDRFMCQHTGVLVTAKYPDPRSPVVHHKQPHGWDETLFWSEGNLEPVSKEWHDEHGQRSDRAQRG